MEIEVLYVGGCPHLGPLLVDLEAIAGGGGHTITTRLVESEDDAKRFGLADSPTILVDGVDLFDPGPAALACRIYPTDVGPSGRPSRRQLEAALGV